MPRQLHAIPLLGLILTLFFLLPGCTLIESYTISEPAPESAGVVKHEAKRPDFAPILESADYQITVQPYNARFESGLFVVIIVPIPQDMEEYVKETGVRYHGKSNEVTPPLVIELGLSAKQRAVSFDPSKVHLNIEGTMSAPDGMAVMSRHHLSFGRRFLFSSCSPTSTSWQPVDTITIEKNSCQFLRLRFDRQPPPPETRFSLEVGGLVVQGEPSPPIRIGFSPKKAAHTDTAP